MLDFITKNSPIIGLIFFFVTFCFIVFYLTRAKTKKDCEKYAKIPLKDND